ncbi:MAG TPA: diguanylate cyclase [Smithellaceae bacterium]|nr:diguanylate cyclase [Smithellaceae bacterium]
MISELKNHSLTDSIINFSIIPQDDPKQALRLRRFFMASTLYIFCPSLAYVSYLAGIMEWQGIYGYLIACPIINVLLYIVFRTGLNKKMHDPSLTIIQMGIGISLVMYGMYYANESRGFLLLVYVIIFLFGIFRLNTRQFLFISVFTLLTYGAVIALLYMFRPEEVNFRNESIQWLILALVLFFFSIIGGYISSLRRNLSISRTKLEISLKEISEIAIRDELTGFYNRRYIMEFLKNEKSRSDRTGTGFSLVMIDIDNFKKINDIYGHLEGDQVLRIFASIINHNLRRADICGRYGGDEFLLILTQTKLQDAAVFAERLRQQVSDNQFAALKKSLDFKITISLGVTEYKIPEAAEKVISRVDNNLYRAKDKGRNRMECSP